MLGYALKQLREERDVKQFVIASECHVTQSTVSKWERSGDLPADHLQTAMRVLGVSLVEFRQAAGRALAGQTVQGREAVDLWRDAVALNGDLKADVKLVLGVLPLLYDNEERFVRAQPGNLEALIGFEPGEAAELLSAAVATDYVREIADGLYELKFPES